MNPDELTLKLKELINSEELKEAEQNGETLSYFSRIARGVLEAEHITQRPSLEMIRERMEIARDQGFDHVRISNL